MADNRKLTAGLLKMPEAQRQDLARMGEEYKRFQEADYLRKMGEQGMGLAKSVARGVPQMATGLVDLASLPFEAAGVIQPGQAVGSTKWLEEKGYLPPPQEGFINQTVEGLSSALDPSAMAAHALPAIGMLGKTVWHGSPHTFDKFDLSKIGTGEGAQAYGHGLYLAEARPTAEEYRRNLMGGNDMASQIAATHLNMYKTPEKAAEALQASISPNLTPEAKQVTQNAIDMLNRGEANTGFLYKVDLPDEQIAKMLDWDKPLSQQAPEVRNALSGFGYNIDMGKKKAFEDALFDALTTEADVALPKQPLDLSGEQMYRKLGNPEYASQRLYEAGIPGIQYLDQASRGAGEGTRNYVVFSDEIPQILERNGQPVAQALRNYGLEHRPMTIEGGASQLHELTPSFGEDVYGKQAMQFFGSGDPREKKALEIMKSVRGNPDAPVTIYRGVPEGVNQINQGDWVTIVPEVAADYGNVISQQVPASHITSWPDSLMEFGYYPPKAK